MQRAVQRLPHNSWSLPTSWSVEQRHLFACLADPDKVLHHFCVYHFHHDAGARHRQCNNLSQLPDALVPPETIFLSDQNSLLVPSKDIPTPHLALEHPAITTAREVEVNFLTQHNMVDSYACVDSGRHAGFDLEGCT